MNTPPHRFLLLVTALSVTTLFISYTFAYRVIKLGALIEPGGTLAFPLTYLLGDIITEVYGYAIARQIIWINMGCLTFYCVMSQLIIHMPSPDFWHQNAPYLQVFGANLKSLIGFIVGLFISDFINSYLLSKIKIAMRGNHYWVRGITSTFIAELVFSLVTDFIVFFHVTSLQHYFHIVYSAFSFKMLYTALAIYPVTLVILFIKEKEGIDTFDYQTNFNPFKYAIN